MLNGFRPNRSPMNSKFIATTSILALAFSSMLVPAVPALAASAEFGQLYYNGEVLRTMVPPAKTDKGLDDIYTVTNGVDGQLGIASVAPGNPDYHGGHWIVNQVTFKSGVTPYLLDSEEAVLQAYDDGDVTIVWNTASFLCPIQP